MDYKKVLMPAYMKDFQCIGSNCEDTCCKGWRVDIDKKTYKKYKNIKDKEIRDIIDKHVVRNRKDVTDLKYAYISLGKQGMMCPLLNEEGLCGLQLVLGEEYLSETCAMYPRTINVVDGVFEVSASLSCPEAARLALLNEKGIDFFETEEKLKIQFIRALINTQDNMEDSVYRYFWDLRVFTIMVLQERKYKLWERLIVLGVFYQKLQECIDNGQAEKVREIINLYTNIIKNKDLQDQLKAIPVKYDIQIEILKRLVDERYKMGIANTNFIKQFAKFLLGINFEKDTEYEEIVNKYNEAYNTYYEVFMDRYEYILENYLVNYVFKELFPYNKSSNVFNAYVMLVLHYSSIKMFLIGIAAHDKGLTEESVISLIQAYNRTIEHSVDYLENVNKYIIDKGYDTLAHMAILIKN